MAEETLDVTEKLAAVAEPPAPGRMASLLAKLRVPVFVGSVIVVECLVAYLYLPSKTETKALAAATVQPSGKTADLGELEGLEDEAAEKNPGEIEIEVDLGEFSVTAYHPVSSSTLRIDFHLWGTVAEKDYEESTRLLDESQNRFREQVIVIVRSADITDLTDAGLGLIKRKILEKTRKTLGESLLRTVVFSDFSFFEQ